MKAGFRGALLLLAAWPGSLLAGQSAPEVPASAGPPPPAAPEVITRDAAGRATVRAVRLTSPLRLDGQIDDAVYASVPSFSDFVQQEPRAGEPATQKTEVWILFDDRNIYVSVKCWESRPDRMVANEMRHDNAGIYSGNDDVIFIFDTFYDRRNGVSFSVNPIGGRAEGQVTNERQYNGDYNMVWDVHTGRFEGGWSVEAVVPFKSLRYRPGIAQVWGFNIMRNNRWNNEVSYLIAMPKSLAARALMQLSMAPTLVGLEVPGGAKNLEIKPYAIANASIDRTPAGGSSPRGADAGLDLKYGVTQSLTADFTYNTDFAQVEADEQQINLTRFNLFFPEKRDFFLENKGMFDFGGVTTATAATTSDLPTLFYSRRIGLQGGLSVPIRAGGRATGRFGRYSLGMLEIQSGEDAAVGARRTAFTVARMRRDILRRSSIGALMTRRSIRERGAGANDAYGVDGTFGFYDNLTLNASWARTDTEGLDGDRASYRAQLDYGGDRYGVQLEQLHIGDAFNPEVGFVRRSAIDKSYALLRFSPRPKAIKSVRKFTSLASMTYIENLAGRVEWREWMGEFDVELQNSDKLALSYDNIYEYVPLPFRIAPGVTLPDGGYGYGVARSAYTFGTQRRVSGGVSLERGAFYDGHRTTVAVTAGRVELTSRFSLQPTASVNQVVLSTGRFTAKLVGSRVTYTMTPMMFVSALLQYNSSSNAVAANVRLRWEYRPGSELFVVFNEQRDTLARSFPGLQTRALIVKVNRLLRF